MQNLISALYSYSDFTDEEMRYILEYFQPVSFKKGDIILKERDVCNNLWFVVSGCVMLAANKIQQGKIIELFSENHFLVEIISFINDTPTDFSLEAVTDTELLCISKKDCKKLDKYCLNWRVLKVKLLEKACEYMTSELINLKVYTREQRYNMLLKKRPFLFQLIPLYIIANYLDMTPVGLSKLRSRLTTANHHYNYMSH